MLIPSVLRDTQSNVNADIAPFAYRSGVPQVDADVMTENEKLGRVIDALIKRSGKTQAEIAELAGMDPANLNRIVKGKQTPPLPRLRALGRVLRVDYWEILRMSEQGLMDIKEADPRKEALKSLIDALDPSQLAQTFRRGLVADSQRATYGPDTEQKSLPPPKADNG